MGANRSGTRRKQRLKRDKKNASTRAAKTEKSKKPAAN